MARNNSIFTTKKILFITLFIESLVVTIAIAGAVILDRSPTTYFSEIDRQGYVTYISCLQFAIAAILAWQIFRIAKTPRKLAKSRFFWLVSSIGLLFLALDDIFEIHEHIDLWLHNLLAIEETKLTDLADDFIVGGYLVFLTIFVAFQWRNLKIFQPSFIFFKLGFVLTLAMVMLDIFSNNNLFISMMTDDPTLELSIQQWVGAIEDSIKIFAEGMFIVGIYGCWQIANSLRKQ
ncbi:hypothetical protein [Myxosarcina sp. GI1]|uniref:hypothetical protein n=1 Tax=Myxosarcina sp. GI1 TaxID=1541065 RepID=UPI000568B923|nr:hypothetical protein [Myxosarcina sp. GI1]